MQKPQPEKAEALVNQFRDLLNERCEIRGFNQGDTDSYMLGYLLATIEQYLSQNSKLRSDMKDHIEWMAKYNEEIKAKNEGEQA